MIVRVGLAALFLLGSAAAPAVAAPLPQAKAVVRQDAAPERCTPEAGTGKISQSWALRRLDFTRVWGLTRGEGVTVAVIDSGVDIHHPQLAVSKQDDLTGTGHRDCVGHGTAVAGIIAARPRTGVPFYGIAPGVRLISIKQANSTTGDVGLLAKGIVKAAELGVDVINISMQTSDQPDLKAAVQYALSQDIVVVAAAGNVNPGEKSPRIYPAAYEGVLSVGSVTEDGRRSDFSNAQGKVSVLAPGQNLVTTWTGGLYRTEQEGTSFAAPYVAGVAALVRARYPRLTQEQVRWRIERTADGALGNGTGAGVVNPWLAVTQVLVSEELALAQPEPAPLPADVVTKAPPVDQRAITMASSVAVGALVLAGLTVAGRVFGPRGRRRGWRAG
ncbi:type VII secretion-associated serine protease mycosin [Nonomuraea sp. NPDC005501]|uniref:type VII secretion-associated serine protease mycosin n=1 Tax=Nonomuraea sp. NPDC005501 TaxID=3156884 RepID=UPI0033B73648